LKPELKEKRAANLFIQKQKKRKDDEEKIVTERKNHGKQF
jgi:hypothetical protein